MRRTARCPVSSEAYCRAGGGTDANDKPWEIGVMGADVLVLTNGSLRLGGKRLARFRELLDRAATPGQPGEAGRRAEARTADNTELPRPEQG